MSNSSREQRKEDYQKAKGNIKEDSWCGKCSKSVRMVKIGPMKWQCPNGHIQTKP